MATALTVENRMARHITAREMVLSFFDHHWRTNPETEVPGTFLVALMADFDISAPNARATLRSLDKGGILMARRAGRSLFFRSSPSSSSRASRSILFGPDDVNG